MVRSSRNINKGGCESLYNYRSSSYTNKTLTIEVAIAIKDGLPSEEALKSVTINPARVLGVDGRVGSNSL